MKRVWLDSVSRAQDISSKAARKLELLETLLKSALSALFLLGHFHNLYLHNGSFYAVTPLAARSTFPTPLGSILVGPPVFDGKYDQHAEPDTVGRWTWLDPETEDVGAILGEVAVRESGVSMFFNDEPGRLAGSFLAHYYHFIGKIPTSRRGDSYPRTLADTSSAIVRMYFFSHS